MNAKLLRVDNLLECKERGHVLSLPESVCSENAVDCRFSFIGDLHGHRHWYRHIVKKAEYSFQLGDIENTPMVVNYFNGLDSRRHRYIHGNHDWLAQEMPPHYLGKYGIMNLGDTNLKLAFVSGAFSVDRLRRSVVCGDPVHDEEELNVHELQQAIDLIIDFKPDIVITHTAPYSTFGHLNLLPHYGPIKSRTSLALDRIIDDCNPLLWVFGHFHQDISFSHKYTKFICVNIKKHIPLI